MSLAPEGAAALLEVRGLRKEYRTSGFGRAAAHVAVDGVDLEVRPGEVVGLIGESGCGKTSLVRTALGIYRRDGGTVRLLGVDPHALGPGERRRRLKRAQLVFQDPGATLNPGLTLRETLHESQRIHAPGQPEVVDEALGRVDLRHRVDARPHQLSGGEKRRATLAQLWIADPLLTVADEPTAALDAARKAEFLDLLLARRGPDRGFLIISHDLPMVLYACDRVVVMDGGKLVDRFDRASMRATPRHPVTRALLTAAHLPLGADP